MARAEKPRPVCRLVTIRDFDRNVEVVGVLRGVAGLDLWIACSDRPPLGALAQVDIADMTTGGIRYGGRVRAVFSAQARDGRFDGFRLRADRIEDAPGLMQALGPVRAEVVAS